MGKVYLGAAFFATAGLFPAKSGRLRHIPERRVERRRCPVEEGTHVDRLDYMARTKTDGNGPLATLGWTAALALVVIGGIAIASALLAPGLVLAAAFPAAGTGAHPWIVDGGPEVTRGLSWRIELMLEYLAAGAVAMFAMLRFGHTLLARLQDWYEGQPAVPARPVAQPVPMVVMPRPGHGRVRTPANDRKRDLRAA